jgi:hypothetical protein
LDLQTLAAHEAVTARDVERNHDSVADPQIASLSADLLDDAHRLVSQDVAGRHERTKHFVEM